MSNDRGDIILEHGTRPTGVCLADVELPTEIPEGRPPAPTSRQSWSQSAKVGRHQEDRQ